MDAQDPKAAEVPMCSQLRCKGLYIPKGPSDGSEVLLGGDTTHWWCERTQYSIGPDQDWVHRTVCTPDRACYRKPGDPS